MALGYFPRKIIKKIESKETLTSCLIPCLLVVNTRQLDFLVTAVVVVHLGIIVARPLNGPFYSVDFDRIFPMIIPVRLYLRKILFVLTGLFWHLNSLVFP